MTTLHRITLGMVNVFLIQGSKGCMLIDTGVKGHEKRILKAASQLHIKPKDIHWIVLTHCHNDHTGSLKALLEATDAKLIMSHIEQKTWNGTLPTDIEPFSPIVKLITYVRQSMGKQAIDKPFLADILVEQSMDLSDLGIDGELILTPGHTKGSLSLLLKDGNVIIGDQLMAFMPWSKPGKPLLGYSLTEIKQSMTSLLEKGGQTFHLSHGKKYDATAIQKAIASIK